MVRRIATKTYLLVWGVLFVLLAVTWASAYVRLGWANTALNLTIAVAKAVLVMVFFMHLRQGSPLTRLFAAAGFFWLAILFTLTLGDYLTRG